MYYLSVVAGFSVTRWGNHFYLLLSTVHSVMMLVDHEFRDNARHYRIDSVLSVGELILEDAAPPLSSFI